MQITEYLDKSGISYTVTEHQPTFTAQRMAAEEHERGRFVAKPVIVKADDEYVMCVLSACCKVDLDALKEQLGAKSVALADEKEIEKLFEDCELGAEPPFGNLYKLTTVIDRSIDEDDHIMFQAGTHDRAISMNMVDYRNLVAPRTLDFSYHTH